MSALAVCLAWIDGVFEVKTPTDGVAFDDYVAHFGRERVGYAWYNVGEGGDVCI